MLISHSKIQVDSVLDNACSKPKTADLKKYFKTISSVIILAFFSEMAFAQDNDLDAFDDGGTVCPDGTIQASADPQGRENNTVSGVNHCLNQDAQANIVGGFSNTIGTGSSINLVSGGSNTIGDLSLIHISEPTRPY